MAIYMKFGSIDGDATLQAYDDWINISYFEWHVDWPITTRAAVKADLRGGKHPALSFITVKKHADSASPGLLNAVCRSNTPRMCGFHFIRTDDIGYCYMEYRFYEALIIHWQMSTGEDGVPAEEVHISFTAFEMSFYPADEENVVKKMLRVPHYDIIENK